MKLFDDKVDLLYIVLSLANIIGGIYKKSNEEVYFDTWSNSKTSCCQELFFNYLEELFKINFYDYRFERFMDLSNYIKELLD
ncbi:MAG: hypothetical protein ACOCRK_06175 [bacterium]